MHHSHWLAHDVFHAATWRAMHGVSHGVAALIALAIAAWMIATNR